MLKYVLGRDLMAENKFILNADDFGMSNDFNRAVLFAHSRGFLKSASLCPNGAAFDNAINEVLPECHNLGIGVHLNIKSGKALTHCDLLTNFNGEFNKSYFYLMRKSKNKKFLKQVEDEFRAQIIKVAKFTKIDHINSHGHTHAIPEIFKITVKLAKEFGIKQIRTQCEEFYTVPNTLKHLTIKYPINLLKIALLKHFTKTNKQNLDGINTNDYIIGIGYTGMMDVSTIECGLKTIEMNDVTVEAIIHPCQYTSNIKNNNMQEFMITQNKELENNIYGLGYKITNYKEN